MKVPVELLNDVKKQWDAMGQNVYEIAMINYHTGKKLADVQGWQMFETHGLERVLYMNSHRAENIYIRALPDARHNVIMLDDIRDDGLQFLRGKYPLACAVETSVDEKGQNYQVWLRLADRYHKPDRMLAERALIHELKSKSNGFYADLGAADGMHLARLTGFRNHGFAGKKDRDHIVRLVEAQGKILPHSTTIDLLELGKQLPAPVKAVNTGGFAGDLDEIRSHEYERIGIIQYFKDKILPTVHRDETDKSKVDFYLARQLARSGFSEKDVRRVLVEHGPNDVSRKEQPADYVCRTVASAMSPMSHNPPSKGGGCGSPPALRRRHAHSIAPGDVPAAASVSEEPEQEAPYVPPTYAHVPGTGRKTIGTINLATGEVKFGVAYVDEPAPAPPPRPAPRPAMLRHGVRPIPVRPKDEFDISLDLCSPPAASGADLLDQAQDAATIGPKP